MKPALGRVRLRSRVVSFTYVHPFHEDYATIRKIFAQSSLEVTKRSERHAAGRGRATYFASRLMSSADRGIGKRKIGLSSQARKQLRKLLHRIGLTNCKCLLPKIRLVVGGQRVRRNMIPIFELHCPKVTGAEASYIESKTRAGDFRISLSLLGTGTNSSATFEEKTSDGISVKDGTCCRIVREARFIITRVRYVCEKCKSTTTTRLLFDLAPGGDELIPLLLHRRDDGCDRSPRRLKPEECKIIQVPKKVTKKKTITITSGARTQTSFGLTVAGVSIQGTVAVETLRDIHHEYVLRGPRTYYHYPAKGINRFWTASKYGKTQTYT